MDHPEEASSFGRAFPRFYIRGLGNTDFDLNASQPVSMVVDEVVLENPVVKGMPLFDLDRVEVLRGPQGTLFGRNTPAGVVKFESRKPTQEFDAFARVSYGTYDTVDIQGGVGGALSKTVSARFSGLYQSRSDWADNQYAPGPERELGAYTTTAARLQFLWEPSDTFSGLLNLHGWEVDGTARIFNGIINWQSDPATKNFFATLDWAYSSEQSFFLYESEEFNDDSFELGLRVGYAVSDAKYEVALFARNLTDEVNVKGGIDFNNLTGYTNDPRIIGVEFIGRF